MNELAGESMNERINEWMDGCMEMRGVGEKKRVKVQNEMMPMMGDND